MNPHFLAHVCLIPLLLVAISLTARNARICRLATGILIWVQLALVTYLLLPLLTGQIQSVALHFEIPSLGILLTGFAADRLSAFFIVLTTFIMACATSHADYFFATEEFLKINQGRNFRAFYAATNFFLLAMTAVFLSDNLGYLWIAVETTTLSSAYLVYFDKTKNALEATWKYLMICTVAIGFALLGTVFIFASSQHGALVEGSLNITELIAHAAQLNFPLVKLGFMFCLIGYGTKAGMFPLHSWMPDAYSEAPAPASAMLSGGLMNCSLFALWRVMEIFHASNTHAVIGQTMTYVGAVTIVAASLLLIRQHSFKRMWAYSSIENCGLMLVAIGINAGGLFLLQAINHSIAKVALFLVSGDIIHAAGSKKLNHLHGVLNACPLWGVTLALGTFALTGCPPFGSFISEITLLHTMADSQRWILVTLLVAGIAISFVAICVHVGRILFGGPKAKFKPYMPIRASIIPAFLICCSLAMGLLVDSNFWIGLK
jgi:hydrogenase-4 component F